MPDFDFDVKRKEWRPKHVSDILNELERAFEAKVVLNELVIMGTDFMQKKRIITDADLKEWLNTESKTYEKLIKLKVPPRLMPLDWQPKTNLILGTGSLVAKYYADEEVSERMVQFTMKFLDCGHFRLKQTLPGSGASPFWVIFEGTWTKSDRGYQLEFRIRYPYQKSRKETFDLAFEAMPENHDTFIAFENETEKQLNGNLPAIVGTEPFCWVELVHEADQENDPGTRFNLEDDEAPKPAPKEEKVEDPKPAPKRPPATSTQYGDPLAKDEEPNWPTYVGFTFFVLLVSVFSWMHWGQNAEEM